MNEVHLELTVQMLRLLLSVTDAGLTLQFSIIYTPFLFNLRSLLVNVADDNL